VFASLHKKIKIITNTINHQYIEYSDVTLAVDDNPRAQALKRIYDLTFKINNEYMD
jgi:predicted metallopeptidase